jgi:hypothetical protein
MNLQGVYRVRLAQDPLVAGLDHAQGATRQVDFLSSSIAVSQVSIDLSEDFST